ncbi:MAG: biotin synthase BioB, partial [Kiritimatiellia bacterium]|nr:biotin synthase BioB [Kiritimatiellia bacterium]
MDWKILSDRTLAGGSVSRDEALAVLQSSDDELLGLLQEVFRVRQKHHGRRVDLHVIRNAKSGLCPENCSFCSQSASATTPITEYPMQEETDLIEGARRAHASGAVRYCMVTSGRGPRDAEVDEICRTVRQIKKEVSIEICTSLGLLTADQARRLAEAGVDRVNHNVESSRRFFPQIVTSHTYDERRETLRIAKAAGLELCCGGILGLGETLEDRVDMAFEIAELDVDSIPVNLLDPRPGTALETRPRMTPAEALRALAMFRWVMPSKEIRVAGGREACLRSLQPLALFAANSIFTEGYL